MNFDEFYRHLGLNQYPFTTFTTENEIDKAQALFVPMTEYGPIQEAFRSGQNMIILGERGVGKTAVLEEFHRTVLGKQVNCVINAFREVPTRPQCSDFHKLILRGLLISMMNCLQSRMIIRFKLRKKDRILLSYLLYYYSDDLTLEAIKESVEKVQIPALMRILVAVFNRARGPLNYAGTILENALKRYFAQNLGIVPYYSEQVITEYFPEIKIAAQTGFLKEVDTFRLLKMTSELIRRLTGCKPVVIFDKLDEDQRLSNDAELISEFLLPLLSDNNLLSLGTLQTVIFVWKTPFRYIESLVRSQKYFCPTIRWNNAALGNVLNRRLAFYSENKVSDYRSFFSNPNEAYVEELFTLANGVPRDLWHLLNKVFEEQFRFNPHSSFLEQQAIETAKSRFVTEFNYYEYYPRKATARRDSMDIYSYYAHLRKVDSADFSKTKFSDSAGTGSSTGNYLTGMERIGLVEKVRQELGDLIYRIKDNRIIYAINRNLDLRSEL